MSDRHVPRQLFGGGGPREGESAADWFRRTFGEIPAPTADMDAPDDVPLRDKRREALMALERTLPAAYAWARFSAPELAQRVTGADTIATARRLCTSARVCIMGPSQAGKTSLAVAMLRRRVWESAVLAAFVPAHRLGVARIQHAAGHGEPEIVTRAMTAPLALLDDLGCERDTATNPVPDVIFERHDANRPTWVTTGFTPEQLVKRYGTGAVRRLFAHANVIRLEDPKPHAPG